MELYLKTRSGANAVGEYDTERKTMVVQKGSIVAPDVHKGGKFRGASSVIEYREQYCDSLKTKQDVMFKSASAAANFVTGQSTNGLIAWKNSEGVKLRSLLKK